MTYATLDDTIDAMKAGESTGSLTAAHKRFILQALKTVSKRVYNILGVDFEPYYEARRFTASPRNINSSTGVFTLNDYLLELDSLSNDGTNKVLDTDFYAYPRSNIDPIQAIRVADNQCFSWYPCGETLFETILITGWWGYRQRYSTEGFVDSTEDVPAGGLTASATSFTATDVDGDDPFGYQPRFSAGNLIRIDDELLLIIATDTATNFVTVRRGEKGTTAVAHTAGTAISTWYVEEPIRRVVARACAYNFSRKGAFETMTITDLGAIRYPPDFPAEVKAVFQEYANG